MSQAETPATEADHRSPILFVLHDFLPHAVAGTELHVLRLAQALQPHQPVQIFPVYIFYTRRDPTLPQYQLETGSYQGIPTFCMIQNYPHQTLKEEVTQPAIEQCFERVLVQVRPGLVHFHHLSHLCLSLPLLARRRGIPTLFTLHDYHLLCPSGGQLVAHPDGRTCAGSPPPSPQRCTACHQHWYQTQGGLETLALRLSQGLAQYLPLDPALPFRAFQRLPLPVKAAVKRFNSVPNLRVTPPDTTDSSGLNLAPAQARAEAVQQLFKSVDGFLAPSQALAQQFLQAGMPQDRLTVLPNPGLEHSTRPAVPPVPTTPLRLIFVGTLAPHKGLHLVLDALNALPPGHFRLTVCGNLEGFPAYTAPLVQQAGQRAGLDVHFVGAIPPEKIPEQLQQAHLLVLASTWPENAPLTVLEAFSLGVPVLAPRLGGIPELIQADVNGLLYDPADAHGLEKSLRRLIDDPGLLERLRHGIQAPLTPSEHASAVRGHYARLETSSRLTSFHPSAVPLPPETGHGPRVSVIIPTHNGGELLRNTIDAVLQQQVPWPFELLLVDSDSSDGVLNAVETLPRAAHIVVRSLHLPVRAFGHGKTRQQAAALARAPLLVFLVQDATPARSDWLLRLVEGLESTPAVGGYARQRARDSADPAMKARIESWTPPGTMPVLRQLLPGERWEQLTPLERLQRAAFDDVCSIIRREHLLHHPFPDVVFGEDIVWAAQQLQAGHALAYLPQAEVLHSHQRSFREDFERARLEHRMLRAQLGLRQVDSLWMGIRSAMGLAQNVWKTRHLPDEHRASMRLLAELLGQAVAGIPA